MYFLCSDNHANHTKILLIPKFFAALNEDNLTEHAGNFSSFPQTQIAVAESQGRLISHNEPYNNGNESVKLHNTAIIRPRYVSVWFSSCISYTN